MSVVRTLLMLLISFSLYAQELEGGSRTNNRVKTIDEILQRKDPDAYRLLNSEENYLVLANYRNGKRWRYFEGDMIRFKNKDGRFFEADIYIVGDSSFTTYSYNPHAERMEFLEFELSEIKAIYIGKRGKAWKIAVSSMLAIVPYALYDWVAISNPPWYNTDFLVITPVIGLGNFLIYGGLEMRNKKRLRKNLELKVVKPVSKEKQMP